MAGDDWWSAFSAKGWKPARAAGPSPPAAPAAPPGASDSVEQRIRRIATERGFSDPDLLVATAWQESRFDPQAVGDSGNSRGVFQENVRGRGAGLRPEQSFDVEASTARAIDEFTAIRQRFPDADPGTWAARAQRPADPVGYARSVNAYLGRRGAATTPAPGGSAGTAPSGEDWWGAFTRKGWTPATATTARASAPPHAASPAPAAATPGEGGYAFPVAGFKGPVNLHHGHKEAVGGSDLMAPAGTPVVAMRGGTVDWANYEGTGGWNVGIKGDDGLTYYYAHLREQPVVKAGDRVPTGARLGAVGNTGNAASTPPHLHIGIGRGIQTGAGAFGGLGREFDAVGLLTRALTGGGGAKPAPGGAASPAAGADDGWWGAFTKRGWRPGAQGGS